MKTIDSTIYSNKCKSHIYKCLKYTTDSLIVNKVLYKHTFGKVNEVENLQIRNLLSKDSEEKIDLNKTIVIKYYDSLFNYKTVNERYEKHVILYNLAKKNDTTNSGNFKAKHPPLSIEKFNKNEGKWIKKESKCIKKFEKNKNVSVLHFFKDSQKNIKDHQNFKLVKDRNVLKNTFFKIMYNYRFLILKPNGDYFLSGGCLEDKLISQLLKDKNWNDIKKDWQISLDKYPINGFGFFKKRKYHKSHCL